MASSIKDARDKAMTLLVMNANTGVQTSTNDLLHKYWSARSGLVPAQKFSLQDHRRASIVGSSGHWFKDVT